MKKANTHLLLGAFGVLATQGPLLANQAKASPLLQQKAEVLNAASLKSIESSWLAVPPICKARGFNADAVSQAQQEARNSVQAIYASYEV